MKPERPKKQPKKKAAVRKAANVGKTKKPMARKTVRPSGLKIPAILLESDATPPPASSGPGDRYVLGPVAGGPARSTTPGDLPEAYGTRKLLLTARDPHWLYAAWDLTGEQLKHYQKLSAARHLVLRIFKDALEGQPVNETPLPPMARKWFVHVGLGGARFVAELGYYDLHKSWTRISTSAATLTPPDKVSDETAILFETVPPDLPLMKLVSLVKAAARDNIPLVEVIQQMRATGFPGLPESQAVREQNWTAQQEAALAKIISMDAVRRVWMGSLEITEVIRRQLLREIASMAAAQAGQPEKLGAGVTGIPGIPGGVEGIPFGLGPGLAMPEGLAALAGFGEFAAISSPQGQPAGAKKFWFNINAELVIYGATAPDASVTISGRPIKLRRDGTFSFRFSLPDGNYQLAAVATAADGAEQCAADLTFQRGTAYRGDVGQHAQDEKLKPPLPDNVA